MQKVIYNPHGKSVDELPFIYGFNNGGSDHWYDAQLIAADGTFLGGHICSHESFMYGDLAIVEGSWMMSRHDDFRKHYPDGYRMDFVPYDLARTHPGLQAAFAEHDKTKPENEGSYAKAEITVEVES